MTKILVVLAVVLGLFAATPAANSETDPINSGVHLIGDSLTYWPHQTVLRDRPDFWTFDGVPGRSIRALNKPLVTKTTNPDIAREYAFRLDRATRVKYIVVGLGTNGLTVDITVEQAAQMYERFIRALRAQDVWKPGAKRIILITPYTDPIHREGGTGAPKHWHTRNSIYARGIYTAARRNPNICVMPWRAVISERRELLYDGIHPTLEGEQLWKNLLFSTIRNCP